MTPTDEQRKEFRGRADLACSAYQGARRWLLERTPPSRVVNLATGKVDESLPPDVVEQLHSLDEQARIMRGWVAEAMGFKLEDFEGEA
jgi:hypothetical protein